MPGSHERQAFPEPRSGAQHGGHSPYTSPQLSLPVPPSGAFFVPTPPGLPGRHPTETQPQTQRSDASDQERYSPGGAQPQHSPQLQHPQQYTQQPAYQQHAQQEQLSLWPAASPQLPHWGGGAMQLDASLQHQQGGAQYWQAPANQQQMPQPPAAQMLAEAACATEPLVSHPRYRKLANLNKCAPQTRGAAG